MYARRSVLPALLLAATSLLSPAHLQAQSPAPAAQTQAVQPAWPRIYRWDDTTLRLYAPQVVHRRDGAVRARAAFALIVKDGTTHYGRVAFYARTRTDYATGTLRLRDLAVERVEFPAAPRRADDLAIQLTLQLAGQHITLPLALVQTELDAAAHPPERLPGVTAPPAIIFTDRLTTLVSIAGAPVLRPVPGADGFQRIINTPALILQDVAGTFHLRAAGTWFEGTSLAGPWTPAPEVPPDVSAAATTAEAVQPADPLLPPNGQPLSPPPALLVATTPTDVIQTDGPARWEAVSGTALQTIGNADQAVFLSPNTKTYYVLLAGRWFAAPALSGPWRGIAGTALPRAFARIAPTDPKANVLISVPGTPQAREAAIAASIPQVAEVPRSVTATVAYDGAPQFASIPGTGLSYAVNNPEPVIRTGTGASYLLSKGVWFAAPAPSGPWTVADAVPPAIYAIPPASPVHYVTGVRIYGARDGAVSVGYTPAYMGVGLGSGGTVVYGSGVVSPGYVGTRWTPAPSTYGVGAGFSLGTSGFGYGFSPGWSWGAGAGPHWGPYAGAAPYGRGWGFANAAGADIYGRWGGGVSVGAGWGGSAGTDIWSHGAWGGFGAGGGFAAGFGAGFGAGVGAGFGAGGFSAYGGHYMSNTYNSHVTTNATTINNQTINNTTTTNTSNTTTNSTSTTTGGASGSTNAGGSSGSTTGSSSGSDGKDTTSGHDDHGDGRTGRDGKDGRDGRHEGHDRDGHQGRDGTGSGSSGSSGTSNGSGSSGSSNAPGSSGSGGSSGASGSSGSSGSSGPSSNSSSGSGNSPDSGHDDHGGGKDGRDGDGKGGHQGGGDNPADHVNGTTMPDQNKDSRSGGDSSADRVNGTTMPDQNKDSRGGANSSADRVNGTTMPDQNKDSQSGDADKASSSSGVTTHPDSTGGNPADDRMNGTKRDDDASKDRPHATDDAQRGDHDRGGDHRDGEHRTDGDHHEGDHKDGEHRDGDHKDGDHHEGDHKDGDHHKHRSGGHHRSGHHSGGHHGRR